jgi:SAM-dependent methyltransferase
MIFTKQAYDYLLSIVTNGKISSIDINTYISSLIEGVPTLPATQVTGTRKDAQIAGVIALAESLGEHRNILEIGCSKGHLAAEYAKAHPEANITAIDVDEAVIETAKREHPKVIFEQADAWQYQPDTTLQLILSLHGCGNLTDRVIELAVENKANVICVPCCYGKIKRRDNQKSPIYLPRSNILQVDKNTFKNVVARRAAKMEGFVTTHKPTLPAVQLAAFRLLVNFDRAFYLQENGYQVKIAEVTTKYIPGSKSLNTPLRYAIIGKNDTHS